MVVSVCTYAVCLGAHEGQKMALSLLSQLGMGSMDPNPRYSHRTAPRLDSSKHYAAQKEMFIVTYF